MNHRKPIGLSLLGLAFAVLLQLSPRSTWSADLVVGSKAFPESRLLAEIMAQLIEAKTTLQVDRKLGLSGTAICFDAIRSGKIDIYPEYTGTALLSILNLPLGQQRDSATVLNQVRREFSARYSLEWLEPFGFSNNYVLAARPGLGVQKISDLRRIESTVRVRFQHEFLDRPDGYPGLMRHYDLRFDDVQGMEHGLAYLAISRNQIDLMDAYATDGLLQKHQVILLEDDLQFFPPYDASPVARADTLAAHPEVSEVLGLLDGRISQTKMVELNYQVVQNTKSIPELASGFLMDEGLIRPEQAATSSWVDSIAFFSRLLGQHLFLTLTATSLASVIGVSLGLLVARRADLLAGPVLGAVGVLQTIPSLAMLAFMVPLLGIGTVPAIVALFLYGLLPIVRNTYTGIKSVPAELKDAGIGMGMTSKQLLLQLELPLATKMIMAGIRTALVINVGTATLGAFIGAGGFGDPISTGLQQNDNVQILQGAIPAALLAIGCDFAMARLERRIEPRGLRLS